MFDTQPEKNEELRYYEINHGEGVVEFSITQTPKTAEDPALERISVYIAQFDDYGKMYKDLQGFFVRDASEKDYRWCANGQYYPVRPQSLDGVIRSYLKQFNGAKKLAADKVNEHIDGLISAHDEAREQAEIENRAEAERRSKIDLVTKIKSAEAKKLQKRYSALRYVNENALVGIAGPTKESPDLVMLDIIELGYDGNHRNELLGAFVQGGWHAESYENSGQKNPVKNKWVWVVDGREIHDYNSTSLNAALNNFLKDHFEQVKKIDNLPEYIKTQAAKQKKANQAAKAR